MSNLTLTVELDAETKSVLSDLVKELSALNRNLARTNIVANKLAPETPDLPEAQPEPAADLKPTPKPVDLKPADLPVEDPVQFQKPDPAPADVPTEPLTEAPKIPLAEFQKRIVAMCVAHPEKKANIQAVVKGYAKCVSAISEEKRFEVLDRLEDLVNG